MDRWTQEAEALDVADVAELALRDVANSLCSMNLAALAAHIRGAAMAATAMHAMEVRSGAGERPMGGTEQGGRP